MVTPFTAKFHTKQVGGYQDFPKILVRQKKYQDLVGLHKHLHGTSMSMTMTCRDATRPDNALLCPRAAAMIRATQVIPAEMFDAHKPVLVDFDIQNTAAVEYRMSMPESLLDLPIDFDILPDTYDEYVVHHGQPTSLEACGCGIEQAIDAAYKRTQQQQTGADGVQYHPDSLPKAHRGRCQPKPFKTINTQALLRTVRSGEYNPRQEVHTFQGQRMVRQLRRLQSILRGLRKPNPPRAVLHAEWLACLRDTSFTGGFVKWCMNHSEIGPPSYQLPSLDTVHTIAQVAKHTVDGKLFSDHRTWLNKAAYFRQMDKTEGNKQAYAMLKQYNQPATETVEHFSTIYFPDGHSFNPREPVQVNGTNFKTDRQTQYDIKIQPAIPAAANEAVTVSQHNTHFTPETMARELNPFWQIYRNVADLDAIDEPALQQALARLPDFPLQDLNLDDSQMWIKGIQKLKGSSARGVWRWYLS